MPAITDPVPFYFPPASGHYEVKPGFYRFGHDFGNGRADSCLFQFDRQFAEYHAAKQAARRESVDKYICFADHTGRQDRAVNQFILQKLCSEYPALFSLHSEASRQSLVCHLSGETLCFSRDGDYLDATGPTNTATTYINGLDALAMQLQEDLALLQINSDENRLTAIHLCFPNHWDPRDKIGTDFIRAHEPVPEMGRINRSSSKLLNAALHQDPLIRFAWGISTDNRLNHHPEPPPGIPNQEWQGRCFDQKQPQAWLRVERQTLQSIPAINSLLFGIRTYHYSLNKLPQSYRMLLARAIRSMSTESLEYKGLSHNHDALQAWLEKETPL